MAWKAASAPSFLNFCCTRRTIAVASSLVPNSAAPTGSAAKTKANTIAKNATARDIWFLHRPGAHAYRGVCEVDVTSTLPPCPGAAKTAVKCLIGPPHPGVDRECGIFSVEQYR